MEDKITFVIPYVNGEDPVWRLAFKEAGGDYDDSMMHGWPRYKDCGTCELLLKSIEKYAPWADVIMVLAMPSQIPDYTKGKNIKFIYHKDFLPREFQPCVFQSNAIETFIGRMNLPEYFIWMNDDMVFTNPVVPEDFFTEQGEPRYTLWLENDPKPTWSHGWNVSNFQLLFPTCGHPKTIKNHHGPTPMRMSWCKEFYNKYKKSLINSVGSIVERQTGQVNQMVYNLYSYIYKSTVSSELKGKCVVKKTIITPMFFNLYDWVCINENSNAGFDSRDSINKLRKHNETNQKTQTFPRSYFVS